MSCLILSDHKQKLYMNNCWIKKKTNNHQERKSLYYINTREIPSELSRENFISSHMKITCYLYTWRDHRCYVYIINRAFESKLIWYFTGVYIINRILHTCLWIWILSSSVQLHISLVCCAHSNQPLEDKIHIHVWACNILYIFTFTSVNEYNNNIIIGFFFFSIWVKCRLKLV